MKLDQQHWFSQDKSIRSLLRQRPLSAVVSALNVPAVRELQALWYNLKLSGFKRISQEKSLCG